MALTFPCPACGLKMRAKDELAGRKTHCPGCGSACRIPGGAEVTARSPEPAPPTRLVARLEDEAGPAARPKRRLAATAEDDVDEERPAARAKRRPVADEDEEPVRRPGRRAADDDEVDDEERPRRRKRRRRSRTGLYLLVGGGVALLFLFLLLGAGGVLAWWYLSPPAWSMDRAQRYLPDNCTAIVSIRLEQLEASKAYQDLKNAAPNVNRFQQQINQFTALHSAGIDQMVLGVGPQGAQDTCMVIHTRKTVTLGDLRTGTGANDYKSVPIGKHTVYERATDAFCLLDGHTVVIGEPSTVRRVLGREQKATQSAGLQEAMKHADFSQQIAFAGQIPQMNQPGMFPGLPPFGGQPNGAFQVDGFAGHVTLGTDIHLAVTVLCRDAKTAEDTRKLLDGGLVAARRTPGLPPEVAQMLDGIKLTSAGNSITGELTVRTAALVKLLQQQQNQKPFFPFPQR
jgi:hypothetical protein